MVSQYKQIKEDYRTFIEVVAMKINDHCRTLSTELIDTRIPIEVLKTASSPRPTNCTFITYQAAAKRGSTVIEYLEAESLHIYISQIIKMYENNGFIDVTRPILSKTIEVLCVQKLYHIDLYNEGNFHTYARYVNGKLIMGDYETESDCLELAMRYFDKLGDELAVLIGQFLRITIKKDSGMLIDVRSKKELIKIINKVSRKKKAI